ITVTLYGLFLVLLTLPVCLLCWLQWHAQVQEWRWEIGFEDVMGLFRSGWYWLWLFVFLAAQALLLIVPVRTIERRPHGRRSIRLTSVPASFLLANLLFAGIFAVLAAWRGDKIFDGLEAPFAALTFLANRIPMLRAALAQVGIPLGEELVTILNLIGLLLFF